MLNVGDVFKVPLVNGKVGFGQAVLKQPNGVMVCLFDVIMDEPIHPDLNIRTLVQSPVLFFFNTTTRAYTKKDWIRIGHAPLDKMLPLQAYQTGITAVWDHTSNFHLRRGNDPDIIRKDIDPQLANKLMRGGVLFSSNSIKEAFEDHFELIPHNPYLKLEEQMPRPEGTVWRIFPEHYPDPTKGISRRELADRAQAFKRKPVYIYPFSDRYVREQSLIINWQDHRVHGWFEYSAAEPFTLELTLLDFAREARGQHLEILHFDSLAKFDGLASPKNIELEVHRRNKNRPFIIHFTSNHKKKPIMLRICHTWESKALHANFNPGETRQYLTGNAGMLIKPDYDQHTPGTYLVHANSGLPPDDVTPSFQDITFRVTIRKSYTSEENTQVHT